jgi:sporulation protein YlmC with PRC-barrel domain
MEIEYGAEVKDRNGKVLGTVKKVIRDSWTGEISKFQVSTELSEVDLFVSPENVAEATPSEVKLTVTFAEI